MQFALYENVIVDPRIIYARERAHGTAFPSTLCFSIFSLLFLSFTLAHFRADTLAVPRARPTATRDE